MILGNSINICTGILNDNGVGLYFNPEEGQEIMIDFNDIISGFKKKGVNLNEDEECSIRNFIYSNGILFMMGFQDVMMLSGSLN